MALLFGRVLNVIRKMNIPFQSARYVTIKTTMGDPLEHATGLEKKELLAKVAGNCDPFDIEGITRGPGTRSQPNEVCSAFDSRIVGCYCHPEAMFAYYMWLHKGFPKRCACGHWYVLVHKAPI